MQNLTIIAMLLRNTLMLLTQVHLIQYIYIRYSLKPKYAFKKYTHFPQRHNICKYFMMFLTVEILCCYTINVHILKPLQCFEIYLVLLKIAPDLIYRRIINKTNGQLCIFELIYNKQKLIYI